MASLRLRLLKTSYLDVGANRYSQISPEEPRLGPDGSVFVQTLGCGIERITGVNTDEPKSQLVYTLPGNWCGVPTIVGHYLVQSSKAIHGLIVLDIANAAKPVEVSRLTISDTYGAHWTAWDAKAQRLVVTSGVASEDRIYLLKLDQKTGALTLDDAFRDTDGKIGFSFVDPRVAPWMERNRNAARSGLLALSILKHCETYFLRSAIQFVTSTSGVGALSG